MATRTRRGTPRPGALSKARIVDAAIAILDSEGRDGLTLRGIAGRLATGAGSIYWHVADKNELLEACTDHVISSVTASVPVGTDARRAIQAISLGIFEAIDAHPWVGAELSRRPWQSAMLMFFESIGQQLQALDVDEKHQFDAAAALINYILGVAAQNATNARLVTDGTDRETFLAALASTWARLDPGEHPFVRRLAAELAEHDDREQFLAGIDMILAGVPLKH